MKLSKKATREFKQIYEGEIGQKISQSEAQEMALRLLRLTRLVYKPMSK